MNREFSGRHSAATVEKIESLREQGFEIIEGNNPRLPTARKYRGREIVRICQTNSRRHGKSINTVWAVR